MKIIKSRFPTIKLAPSKVVTKEREPLGELIAKAKSKSLRTESYTLDKIRNTYGTENDPTKMSYISINQERIGKVANRVWESKTDRLFKIDVAADKRLKSRQIKFGESKTQLKIKVPTNLPKRLSPVSTFTTPFGKKVADKVDTLKIQAKNLADKARENTVKKMEKKLAIRERRTGSKINFTSGSDPQGDAIRFKETKRSWGFGDDDFSPIQKQSYAKSKTREESFYSPLTGNPLSGAYQDPFTKQFVIKKPVTFAQKQNVKNIYSKLKSNKKK